MKRNYQKELDKLIEINQQSGIVPTLLLHSCCAPCSSYVIEYLSNFFKVTVLYFNPNIGEESEYLKRRDEQKRLVAEMPTKYPVYFIDGDYHPQDFYSAVKGLENEPERGRRCSVCFAIRLNYTAEIASKNQFDYFATTLTLSPLKNAEVINSIGEGILCESKYLASDFKKREGYKRSIVLSNKYNLYRQNYCGCVFSKIKRSAPNLKQT
ncbi:MAG: epoxyqueuosine reductase QueH [Ruminococcus sp.]|nr:epoxyqueuosine reductase QueH [Ruminococcus sp.]